MYGQRLMSAVVGSRKSQGSISYSSGHEGLRGRREGIFLGDLGHRLSSKKQVSGLMVFLKSQGLAVSSSSVSCSRMIIK